MKGVCVLGFAVLATMVAYNVAAPRPGPPSPPEAVLGLRTLLGEGKGPGLGNFRGAGFARHDGHGPGCRGRGGGGGNSTAAPTNTTASG